MAALIGSGGGRSAELVLDPLSALLAAEFPTIGVDDVNRRIVDVWVRAAHLGVDATPDMVERIAREHLLGMVNSSPPSQK
jgi:hypothetical protein